MGMHLIKKLMTYLKSMQKKNKKSFRSIFHKFKLHTCYFCLKIGKIHKKPLKKHPLPPDG